MKEIIEKIKGYYLAAEQAYNNWGRDEEREGVYALHAGFAVEGRNLSHYEEVKELTRQLINFAQLPPRSLVLDAGCGSGALTFELVGKHPSVKVVGVNIAYNQLISAENYRHQAPEGQILFSCQDYHYLSFPTEVFDAVIFCESYVHSYDKVLLMQETFRVLKPGGRVVLSDMFLLRDPLDEVEGALLEQIKDGWCIPSVLKARELENVWEAIGFTDIVLVDHTPSIIGSVRRMSEHASLRITEGDPGSEILRRSRRAPIASHQAIERGLLGYYFARGCKPG
ncbi:MAG: Methyltransferase type 11 [Candidatus Woesebacteria bacterium]|nr:MAG: Methyltransferase type 11 [Candidatus Woesebacteria bacterium]